MRIHRLLFGLALLPAGLAAQQLQSVRGTVRDGQGAPIAGADVLFGDRSTTTNSQGIFRIDSLRPGPYYITIRFAGYVPIRTRVEVDDDRPTELGYRMDRAPFVLPPVVTELRRSGIYGAVGDTMQRPLAGVRVEVAGVNGGVRFTDSLGGFAFPSADRGTYLVRITHPGYGERRFSLQLRPSEGRQIIAVLSPSLRLASRADDVAFERLRNRLAFGLARDRLSPSELTRYGSLGLCDIPRIAGELGRGQGTTTVILNGVEVLSEFPVPSLCAWRSDEVGLVELGRDICADVTQTVGQSLPVPTWCLGRTRNAPRSITGAQRIRAQSSGGSYIVIWEKR